MKAAKGVTLSGVPVVRVVVESRLDDKAFTWEKVLENWEFGFLLVDMPE